MHAAAVRQGWARPGPCVGSGQRMGRLSRRATRKNRRLGQSITGVMQCSEEQLSWLSPGYEALRQLDKEYSAVHGIPESIRLTTVQPGGTLPLLPGVASATGPVFSEYFIRRIRFGSNDPLLPALRKRGHNVVPEVGIDGTVNHTRMVDRKSVV